MLKASKYCIHGSKDKSGALLGGLSGVLSRFRCLFPFITVYSLWWPSVHESHALACTATP